jgi:hypothetical protein
MTSASNHSHPDARARSQMLTEFARRCASRQPTGWNLEARSGDQTGATTDRNADKTPQ